MAQDAVPRHQVLSDLRDQQEWVRALVADFPLHWRAGVSAVVTVCIIAFMISDEADYLRGNLFTR